MSGEARDTTADALDARERFERAAPRELHVLARTLGDAGHQVHVVGGSIRDLVMGRTPGDWDIATDATPERVGRLFARTTQVNARHGTVQVRLGDHAFEVTTYRLEGPYSDRRRPDFVRFATAIEPDLERRDFTVNALAFDPLGGALIDPHEGLADIRARRLRTVGDPRARFREDALRLMRAARFSATLEFEIDPATRRAMRAARAGLRSISAERVRDEILKGLAAARPSRMFEAMREAQLLEIVLPELAAGIGVEQNEFHAFDVYTHSLGACDAAPRDRPLVRLAALLHDVGKVPARRVREGRVTFYDHERIGTRMVVERLTALKLPRKDIAHVAHLVAQHMFHYEPTWTDAAVRRFIARAGVESLDDLFALRHADVAAKGTDEPPPVELDELARRIAVERARATAFRVRDLAVSGDDVMRELGLEAGPAVGRILQQLLGFVLDGGANDRETLLAEAHRLAAREGSA